MVGFGADSLIEVTAGVATLWRLGRDVDPDSLRALIGHEPPRESVTGIVLAAASLVVMPLLARAKRKLALAMKSGGPVAEAMQTALCTWLSAILLGGPRFNAVLGLVVGRSGGGVGDG